MFSDIKIGHPIMNCLETAGGTFCCYASLKRVKDFVFHLVLPFHIVLTLTCLKGCWGRGANLPPLGFPSLRL